MRDAEDDVVVQFSDSENDNHDVQIENKKQKNLLTTLITVMLTSLISWLQRVTPVFPNASSCCRLH